MLCVEARRLVYQCLLAAVPVFAIAVVVVVVVFVVVVIVLVVDGAVALVWVRIWDLVAADNQRKMAEILTEVAAGR